MPVEVKSNRIKRERGVWKTHAENTARAGAIAAEKRMLILCPVSDEEYPGKVHMVETIARTPDDLVRVNREGQAVAEVKVGDESAGVYYTGYVVFGTRYIRPNPFPYRAFETGRTAAIEAGSIAPRGRG